MRRGGKRGEEAKSQLVLSDELRFRDKKTTYSPSTTVSKTNQTTSR